MRSIHTLTATVAISLSVVAVDSPAQTGIETSGEVSEVRLCFYECKEGYRADWWQEVTSLMIMNPDLATLVDVAFLDGNEQFIARTRLELSEDDLDELNVCRTLEGAGIVTPSAGMILLSSPPDTPISVPHGYYAYVKNLLGKFFKNVDEPFEGRVSGVGKTECRVVPPSVTTWQEIAAKVEQQNPPVVPPILIEDTGDR